VKNLTLRVFIGVLFSTIGLVTLLITKETLTAAIWLSFGNALILSDLRFSGIDVSGQEFIKPIPKARLIAAGFLFVLAVLLLMFQIYLDFSN
jgi:hypothetical protein